MDVENLGRHVQRRADGAGGPGRGDRAADARNAEVGQARDPRGGLRVERPCRGATNAGGTVEAAAVDDVDEDVGRLDIAVHDSRAVHHGQPLGQERPDPGNLLGPQGPPGLQEPTQVPTADVVHDDGGGIALHHHVLNADHVGGAHPHESGPLAHEALDDAGILEEVGAQELHREVGRGAVDAPSEPDLALGAGTDERGQNIGAAKTTGPSCGGRGGSSHADSTRSG